MEDGVMAKEMDLLMDMKQKIEEIERLAIQLKEMGRGMPVIEINVRAILSFTHVLRFGIADPAGV